MADASDVGAQLWIFAEAFRKAPDHNDSPGALADRLQLIAVGYGGEFVHALPTYRVAAYIKEVQHG